jgi:hypothetical protein
MSHHHPLLLLLLQTRDKDINVLTVGQRRPNTQWDV